MHRLAVGGRQLFLFSAILFVAAASSPTAGFGQMSGENAAEDTRDATTVEGSSDEIAVEQQNGRAIEASYKADFAEALKIAEPNARFAEERLGPNHPLTLVTLGNLASTLASLGRFAEAETAYRRVIAASEETLGADHKDTLTRVDGFAQMLLALNRYDEAEQLDRRTLAARERSLGPDDPDTITSVSVLASDLAMQGRHEEALPLYQRAVAAREIAFGPDARETLISVAHLADTFSSLARHDEAERLYRRVVATQERLFDETAPALLTSLNNLSSFLYRQERWAEAEAVSRRVLAIREQVLGANDPATIMSLNNLATIVAGQKRLDEAERMLRLVIARSEASAGSDSLETVGYVKNLADVLASQQRFDEAEPLFRRALEATERKLGPQHPQTRIARMQRVLLGLLKPTPEALNVASDQIDALRTARTLSLGEAVDRSAERGFFELVAGIHYARIAWSLGRREDVAPAFEAMQLAGATSAGRALARGTALATLNPEGQALVVARETLVGEIEAVDAQFAEAAVKGDEAQTLSRLTAARAALDARREQIDAALKAGHARYFELVQPRPVSLAALRGGGGAAPLLKVDEAFVLLYPGEPNHPEGQRRGFVFAITREGAAWQELPVEPDVLAALIADVRNGSAIIDPTVAPPVPRARAKQLYDILFGAPEIAALISAKPKWILSPQQGLLTAPFAALVTKAPSGEDNDPDALAETAWLGIEKALSIVPEAHMLNLLRGVNRPDTAASAPYFAVADPALAGTGGGAAASRGASRAAATFYRGATGFPDAIMTLEPLPNTAEEARQVAKALGAGPDRMLTGTNATEARFRASATQIAQSRVIHFATHALVNGEMKGVNQPALVLMPPQGTDEVREDNDGLLTAAEVATLKLNADWVILSACNTAAGSGEGAEGLSGLARSFFYSGAASMLVSQWPVRDDSGAMLITETVKAVASSQAVGRAEALRQAMRAVMLSRDEGGARRSHPQDWAPFMFVGVDR